MKKIYCIIALVCTYHISAMDQTNRVVEAKVYIVPFNPEYAAFNETIKRKIEASLGKEIDPGTLLQKIHLWENTYDPQMCLEEDYTLGENQIPAYLPIDLLPDQEDAIKEITLFNGTIIKLHAKQLKYNICFGTHLSRFEKVKNNCIANALYEPINKYKKIDPNCINILIENRVLQHDNDNRLIPGPQNKYLDKTDKIMYAEIYNLLHYIKIQTAKDKAETNRPIHKKLESKKPKLKRFSEIGYNFISKFLPK